MANGFTFNGVDFGTTHGVTVLSETKIPCVTGQPLELVGVPGADVFWPFEKEGEPLEIELVCRVGALSGYTLTQFKAQIRALTAALKTDNFAFLIWYYDAYKWSAMWDRQPLEFTPRGRMAAGVTIRFLAKRTMVAI